MQKSLARIMYLSIFAQLNYTDRYVQKQNLWRIAPF